VLEEKMPSPATAKSWGTDPKKALGTIRADLAQSIEQNVVHGSDADTAARGRLLLQRHRAARAG
jgi:nucleoside diphosphate kinase